MARLVGVERAVAMLHGIKEVIRQTEGLLRDRQTGSAGALQGHQLPAENACVACLFGCVTPAAPVVLSRHNKVDALLRRFAQLFIACHEIGFAEHNRGLPVGVHARVSRRAGSHVAIGLLVLHQPPHSLGDNVLVLSDEVGLPGSEEGKEGQ